jgi:hypothetical protein
VSSQKARGTFFAKIALPEFGDRQDEAISDGSPLMALSIVKF